MAARVDSYAGICCQREYTVEELEQSNRGGIIIPYFDELEYQRGGETLEIAELSEILEHRCMMIGTGGQRDA